MLLLASERSNWSRRPPRSRKLGSPPESTHSRAAPLIRRWTSRSLSLRVDPAGEPIPLPQQRLVGHLHRGPRAHRVAVVRQQPERPELVEHRVEGALVDGQALQLGPPHPPSGVAGELIDGHQPEKELAGCLLCLRREFLVQLLGSPSQCPEHPSGRSVGVGGEQVPLPPLEKLRQGILEEGKGTGLSLDLVDHLSDQPRLQLDADTPSRAGDGLGQPLLGRRNDSDHPLRRPVHRTRGIPGAGRRSRRAW